MKYTLRVCVFIFLGLSYRPVFSQIDTAFWFAAPEVSNSLGEQPIHLRLLSYGTPATVTISQPANLAFTPIVVNLPANTTSSVNLSPFLASIESPAANVVSNNGLKISSTAKITAYYELGAANNREIFSLKGTKAKGTNFYAPFQKFWNNGTTTPASFSSIDIVATQNGTTVLITPRTDITGHAANFSFSVTLNAGQTYSARDMNTSAATSLAGSIISSNKPISVTCYSGAMSNSGVLSTMADQITPADFAGTDFIIHKGSASGERLYIMATQNGTTVNLYGASTTSTLINWSETYEHVMGNDTVMYIKTSKPVYVWHASGRGRRLCGAQVPNMLCAGTYETGFTRSNTDSLGIRLYTRTGFEGMFTLNGVSGPIPASAFKTVPGTSGNFKSALIFFNTTDVPVGSYNLVENTGDVFGMAVFSGQSTTGMAYAFLSEFNSYPFVDAGANDTVCANISLPLNGVVGGGSVTGTWSGTGYGSFQSGSTALVNTYIPSPLDTLVSPIKLILSSTGPCPVQKDTLLLYVNPAPIVNASADQTVCANNANVNLNGSVSGGSSTGIWSTLGSGTFAPGPTTLNAVYIPSSADTAAGSVTLVLTSTDNGSCNAVTDTMKVTFTNIPHADAGPATLTACKNNASISLAGTISGITSTGKWTSSGSGIFTPNNLSLVAAYNPSTFDLIAGSVTIYLESTGNGSCIPAKDSILITFTDAPVADAGVNQFSCTNAPAITLSGSVTGSTTTGVWSGGAGTFSPNDSTLNAIYTPTPSEIAAGTLFLTLTSTNNGNCVSVNDNMQINFVAPPFANFNLADVCLNETNSFTDFSLPGFGSLASWTWNFDDLGTSTMQNPTHLYTAPGTYNVQLIVSTSAGCKDTVVKPLTVHDLPVASFTFDAECSGANIIIHFNDNSTISDDALTYWFYDFGGMGAVTAENPSQLFVGSGNFIITHIVGTSHGCRDTVIQTIPISPRPSAGFYYNTDNGLNVGATFDFTDTSSNAVSWAWTFGDGNNSLLQNPSNTYFANGNYIVTQYAYDAFGCVDSASVIININTVTNTINTLIPNAISPNGDGKNDVWKLPFIKLLYPQATVEVYNRWGQQIFYSEGYETPWDGTYKGEQVTQGTYYYIINLNVDSEPEPYKGTILVLKQ